MRPARSAEDLRRQTHRPVPRHARGGTGRRRQYPRCLSPRPHGFSEFLAHRPGLCRRQTQALRDYLADLDARGFKSSSVARRLSAMRHLFRFLLNERIRSDDPAAILSGPKRGRGLPKVLSIADVDRLLVRAKALDRSAGSLCAAAASRAAALLPAGSALRHRACGCRSWWRCRCRRRGATPA